MKSQSHAPLTLAEYKAELVTISGLGSPFRMGRTPVTVGMWQEYAKAKLGGAMPELPEYPVWKDGWEAVRDHPIVNVSWDECTAYADWAGLTLPSEAKWEFAARGELVGKLYPWGDAAPEDQLWWTPTSGDKGTAPVKRPNNVFVNGYGLVDMAGNVWEWCEGWYDSEKTCRPLRGGSWLDYNAGFFRCANRGGDTPDDGIINFGFRLSSPGLR